MGSSLYEMDEWSNGLLFQLNNWTNGQNAYQATWVYHFGHQPPNIATNCSNIEDQVDIDVNVDSLASSAQEGLINR